MRVLLDTRPASTATGIGRYTRTLAELLRGHLLDHDVWTLGYEGADVRLESRTPLEAAFEVPALIAREGIDVLHSTMWELPPVTGAATIISVHDAVPMLRPDLTNPDFAHLFEGVRGAAEQADAVVCPSESAKRDLVRAVGIPEAKIRVIPETPAACFAPAGEDAKRTVRAKFGLERAYVLVVGSIEARKNPGVVLEALASLPLAIDLVFAGPEAGFDVRAAAAKLGVEGRVRVLGRVSDEDLVALYSGALALVHASLYEGFGLPIVEGFACEVPVIASNAASLPEIAGDAAILFSPEDVTALAAAIREVHDSEERRADLVRRGRERLAIFSPERVRCAFADLYTSLAVRVCA